MTAPKTVALIEPGWSGHLPAYFRAYCIALLEAGHRVIALCPRPLEVEQWAREQGLAGENQLACAELTDRVVGRYWVRKIPLLANNFRFRDFARVLAAQEAALGWKVDLAFFTCLYNGTIFSAAWMDRIFPYPWTGLLLDSTCVRWPRWRQWIVTRSFDHIAAFRAGNCRNLATLDKGIAERLSRRLDGKPVHALPELSDPTVPSAADLAHPLPKSIRRQADGRRIIGCCGQFSRRKGALAFLQTACRCRDEPWFFFWAGEDESTYFTPPERRWIDNYLSSAPSNCLVHLGRVADDREYNALISLSDVLFLCYKDHPGSSNTISKAADFEKRVLVSDGYCMAEETRLYDLGLCVPEDDLDAIEAALHRLLQPDSKSFTAPRFEDYRQEHTQEHFKKVVRDMVADSTGEILLPPFKATPEE